MRTVALALGLACLAAGPAAAISVALPDIRGPQVVCFKYSAFRLAKGERVADLELGLEGLSLDVSGPRGTFTIAESEIWRQPETPAAPVLQRDDLTAFQDRTAEGPRYGLLGQTYFSAGRDRLLIWLSGPALDGGAADREILGRFMVGDPGKFDCGRRYTYTMDADGPEE